MSRNIKENMNNLNIKLDEIFNEHKLKNEKVEYLEIQLEEREMNHEKVMFKNNKEFQTRMLIYDQRLKQQEERIKIIMKKNDTLKKENYDFLFFNKNQQTKIQQLTLKFDSTQKHIEKIRTKICQFETHKKELKFQWNQALKTLKNSEKKVKSTLEQKYKTFRNLLKTQKLQKTAIELMKTREKEVKILSLNVKNMKISQINLEEELRQQFQKELIKYVGIRKNYFEQEKEMIKKEWKERNKKKLNEYKKILILKEKDINLFKIIIQRFKKISQDLKKEKNKANNSEKYWKEKSKKTKINKIIELNEKEKKIKVKEKLIRDLRGKYFEKIIQVQELLKKQKNLNTELNIYRKFIQNEEKKFGFTSKNYKKIDLKKTKLKKKSEFYENILQLDSININKGELILSSIVVKPTSLLGWVLFNDQRSQKMNLPNVSLEGDKKIRILFGKEAKKNSLYDICWFEDLFSKKNPSFIHLMDPSGIIQSSIMISGKK